MILFFRSADISIIRIDSEMDETSTSEIKIFILRNKCPKYVILEYQCFPDFVLGTPIIFTHSYRFNVLRTLNISIFNTYLIANFCD